MFFLKVVYFNVVRYAKFLAVHPLVFCDMPPNYIIILSAIDLGSFYSWFPRLDRNLQDL